MCGHSIVLISVIGLVLTSCTFLSNHPQLKNDVKEIQKDTIDAASSDLKNEIENQ